MELEEGECESSGDEEEYSGVEVAALEEEDSSETSGAILTVLQQQLQKDLVWPCADRQLHNAVNMERGKEEEEEEGDRDKVPRDKLQELGSSEALRGMLANPHLCHLLVELDGSSSPQQAVRKAMNIPVFVEFADECLRICGLRDSKDP